MKLTEFKKSVIIYKSHPLRNGFISITYSTVLGINTVSGERTVEIEKNGGALHSLYYYIFNRQG
jgi:hypothetical protein